MPITPLTLAISLIVVFTSVVFFLLDHARRVRDHAQKSLLRLHDETPPVPGRATAPHLEHSDDRDHEAHGCGCHSGARPPCPGCLKSPQRRDTQEPLRPLAR